MKPDTPKHFNYRPWLAVAVSAAFLVPLAAFGAPALAKSAASASQYQYGGSSQYQYKVRLCHHTHSKKHPWVQLSVGAPAAKAHLRRHDGDVLGTCPTAAPTTPKGHGGSGDQGKKGDDDGQANQNSSKGKSGEHGKSASQTNGTQTSGGDQSHGNRGHGK